MTCTLALTILILGQSFPVDRTYTGNLLSINEHTYTMDFSNQVPWLDHAILVPKHLCEKAD